MVDHPEQTTETTRAEEAKALKKSLFVTAKNLWDVLSDEEIDEAMAFGEEYLHYLDVAKTERELVSATIEAAESLGYRPFELGMKLQPGDRVYQSVHGKGLLMATIGTAPIDEGFRILGAHVDSPRVDLKPMPLYEEGDLALFKTHYYGGIKKYQWVARPLALHGVVMLKDGTRVEIRLGEEPQDPVFCFTDLLPHLGREQMKRAASEIIQGEELNLLIGGRPFPDEAVSQRFKLGVMQLLNERYGLTERDFATAELEIVPAGQAKFVGLDRSFLGGYGQDDRVCAYTSMRALFEVAKPRQTAVCMLTDKEEIGSDGNTGAQSRLYENFLAELYGALHAEGYSDLGFRRCLAATRMLSSDVTNAYDPTFAFVSDPKNESYMGRGIAIQKYTGHGGKYGASDASAELMQEITSLLDAQNIPWQAGEMGRVDAGGGGTICKLAAAQGMQVVDCGVPVLSMHSPFELTHTLDVFYTYRAYRAFLEA